MAPKMTSEGKNTLCTQSTSALPRVCLSFQPKVLCQRCPPSHLGGGLGAPAAPRPSPVPVMGTGLSALSLLVPAAPGEAGYGHP